MSKTTKDVVETVDTSIETSTPIVDAPTVTIVRTDNFYSVKVNDQIIGPCKQKFIKNEGDWVIIPANPSGRTMVKLNILEKFFTENGDNAAFILAFKAPRTLGSTSTKLPNEKLISYLPEAEQEEYKAIIARAIQARDAEREANKKKPMTEREKLEKKIIEAKKKLLELGVTEEDINAALNVIEEVQA